MIIIANKDVRPIEPIEEVQTHMRMNLGYKRRDKSKIEKKPELKTGFGEMLDEEIYKLKIKAGKTGKDEGNV